jgi:hypothetical protein
MSDTALETRNETDEQQGSARSPSLVSAAWHCHRGQWHRGLAQLKALKRGKKLDELPILFLSYLGHAMARCERAHEEGERLCRLAVDGAFYRPETHWNLASVRMLARDLDGAREALAEGLALDPDCPLLLELREKLEARSGGGTVEAGSLLDRLRRLLGRRRG